LAIGVDANADELRAASRRFAAKPARGGLPNALLGRLALADAPGEIAGLADRLTLLLPWGSLLRAVALPDAAALAALRALCRPEAELCVVFGYGPQTEATAIRALALPALDDPATPVALQRAYRDAGFAVIVRELPLDEVRALPTTWAKKLAYSGRPRRFVELRGSVTSAPGCPPAPRAAGTSKCPSRE
jgi:16S rRNA (adenine(1408)-N(1))-methyltransferase